MYTIDLLQPEGTNQSRHTQADLSKISEKTIERIIQQTNGTKFHEISLDFCWCENSYYSERMKESFFNCSLPLLSKLLTDTGSIFLPFIPCFIARTYAYRFHLQKSFKEVKYLNLETVRQNVSIVKGHESVSHNVMGQLGKESKQLDRIQTSITAVHSELSPTGALMEKKQLNKYIMSILLGRTIETMKMIRLQLNHYILIS